MKLLFIGDIVAKPGRQVVSAVLPDILASDNIDLVIANAENLAHGRGATEELIIELKNIGIDYFTGGDHIFWQRDFETVIDKLPVLRPANYPDPVPGKGYNVIDLDNGEKVLLINVMGRTSFSSTNSYLNDPFRTVDTILEETAPLDVVYKIVDFHAEATSEKQALAFYLDGRVTAVFGTHTHVPTCDQRVLPKGTLAVTDVGMSGSIDSVIGVKKDIIIDLCLSARNQRFEWETSGALAFRSVLIDTDGLSIKRIDKEIN
ncbi:MAG: TIGR00282 family metallophosphoesterase [Patescibacteria group bacterium]